MRELLLVLIPTLTLVPPAVAASFAMRRISNTALEGMTRQPEIAPQLFTSMLVSMALVDTARSYTALATQVKEGKNPEPTHAEKCLAVAEHALKLAEIADRLGDKNVARAGLATPPAPEVAKS
jgi:hypothetical protein